MRITVTRPPGDNLSPEPIINPLATQQDVGIELGKAFIYDSDNYHEYTIRMPYRGEVYPAQKVAVYDETLGENFVALVVGHDISITKSDSQSIKITSILTLRRILTDE